MGIFNNIFGGNTNDNLAKLVDEGAFLVDVRTPEEFAEGNVKESTNIPLDQVAVNLDKFKGKENIVVFCRSGNRSGQATYFLQAQGIDCENGGSWLDVNYQLSK